MRKAADRGAELAVFPEMMLTGYDSHLHEFFKISKWFEQVEEALRDLSTVADETGIAALVGSPYPSGDGYLNALLLLKDGETPMLAGARTFLNEGWKKVFGFVEAQDRSPVHIQGIAFGSVFCAEASFLDHTTGKGLENSDVILWVSVSTSQKDEQGQIIRDGPGEGVKAISQLYGVPVIQSNYVSQAVYDSQIREASKGRILGGSVICDTSGQILRRASLTEEEMLICDVKQVGDTVIVLPVEDVK